MIVTVFGRRWRRSEIFGVTLAARARPSANCGGDSTFGVRHFSCAESTRHRRRAAYNRDQKRGHRVRLEAQASGSRVRDLIGFCSNSRAAPLLCSSAIRRSLIVCGGDADRRASPFMAVHFEMRALVGSLRDAR